MAQEVVDEAENRHKKKQRTAQLAESNETEGSQEQDFNDIQDGYCSINDGASHSEDTEDDIWYSCHKILKNPKKIIKPRI
jgi:hypothetical protein